KEESLQSNKPCKNQDAPEFCEFFEIKIVEIDQDAKQYQAKSPLLKAEFLKTNDMVEKEVYNELSNRFLQLEKHCISLEISMQQKEESFQSNKPCKNQESPKFHEFFEINDLKAQLQAKTTLICNLKNQIKSVKEASNEAKLKNDIDVIETINIELEHKVAKLLKENETLKSITKTCMIISKFERPKFSKPRFASQVDVKNDLPKPVTPHYLAKVRESVFVKPYHVIAPGSSWNSQEESYGSNDMAHNHYLEEARKKTQERNRNSKSSVMHTTGLQITTNGSKQKPRSNNQSSRSLPVSKSSGVNSVPLVNSRVKVQSFKTRNNNKPVEPKSHTQKPGRQIAIGQRFSFNKSSVIPTGKMFIDSTTKVDSEPPNSSNEDITNPYECDQTLNVHAGTLNLSAGTSFNPNKERLRVWLPKRLISHKPGLQGIQSDEHERWCLLATLQAPFLKEKKVAAQEPVASTGTPSSTTIDQDATSTSTSQTTQESQSQVIPPGVEEEYHDIKVAHMEYDLYFGLPIPEPSSIESSSRIVIPTNLADIFTKPLGRERLEFLMKKIGMQSMSPETLKRMVDETEEYWGFLVPGERRGGGKKDLNTVMRSVDSSSTRNDKHPNTKRKGIPSDDPTGSIAKKIDEKGGEPSRKTVNFRTLLAPAGNRADVAISLESFRVVYERLSNNVYGFFLVLKMDVMIENDPWLIRNVPLISKKWTPDANIMKEHVCNIPVWVKFHDIPITMFTEDSLGAIATKLDTPMLIDSYTSAMCTNSWGRSSYVKAMVELRVNVELKDTLVVDVPKFMDVLKNLKNPRQAVRGVQNGASSSVENDDEMSTNRENSKFAGKGANSYVVSSAHGTSYEAFGSPNTTPLATRINDLKRKMLDGKLVLVDDNGSRLKRLHMVVLWWGCHDCWDLVVEWYSLLLGIGLSNVAEVGFTVWLKHKKINVSNSRVSKLLIVPTDVLRQHEIVTTDVVNVHKYYIDLLEFRSSTGSIGKHWREFVNEAALVKSVKVVAECLAVRLIFVIILTLSATVNENLDRETMNTWTTKAPMISAIMSQLFNHTRYKKDLLLELLTVARHRDVLEKHGAPNFWKHFDVVLDLEMEDRDVQEALEEISREKQYQEKCLSMLVNSLELCQDDTNTSTEGKM
ncbi:retrovirus-related pol polyprotein from transposon TNT 1-94, partial [Tanacetum coccineum]